MAYNAAKDEFLEIGIQSRIRFKREDLEIAEEIYNQYANGTVGEIKTRIKEISCNELRRIYPFQLQEWVGVEERELGTFIDELLKANLMEEKYDFQCDCGNDCTVYQKELERNGFVCPECDRNYIPNEIAGKATVLYEIDKKSLLRYDQSSIDLKKRLRIVGEEKDELRFSVEYEQYDEVQKKRKVKVFFHMHTPMKHIKMS